MEFRALRSQRENPSSGGKGRFRFTKAERIRKRRDFLTASGKAEQRVETKSFLVLLRSNREGRSRLGVTVTRKVGNAVMRNRIKRRVREFFRLHKHQAPQGADIVIIARKGAGELEQRQVDEQLKAILSL